jgi:ribose transport system substrate-binding protein
MSLTPAMPPADDEHWAETRDVVEAHAKRGMDRRDIIRRGGLAALLAGPLAGVLSACSSTENASDVAKAAGGRRGAGLKMLGSNGGLGVSWFAQGKQAMERCASDLGIQLDWVDGELNSQTQRAKLDNAVATKSYDIAAISANEAGTCVPPVNRLSAKGTKVIQMISSIGGPQDKVQLFTSVEQSSYEMGFKVATALFEACGGKGTVIQTQGPAAFTGAQERARGFKDALKNYPGMKVLADDFGNWDTGRARDLWDTYLNKFPEITCGYFQNDDMAFAGLAALKAAGRLGKTRIGGCDAMPQAIKAVQQGTFTATMRHSAPRVHTYPVLIGLAAKLGAVKEAPKQVVVDGPVVTKDNAETLLFLQNSNLLIA